MNFVFIGRTNLKATYRISIAQSKVKQISMVSTAVLVVVLKWNFKTSNCYAIHAELTVTLQISAASLPGKVYPPKRRQKGGRLWLIALLLTD